jgi:predicted lysophospholipase L1 biosynthesis ABC-type transport system permease subunit
VGQDFEKLYAAENRVATLSRYFAVIAIMISCLGLFGLAAFTAERRTKEIAIRKILGATMINVLMLLSSDFMKLIFLSIVIAIPVSVHMGDSWLSSFAYRIDLQWWYFLAAGLVAIAIAGSTIISQVFRTSNINPVQSIKSE